MSNDQRKADLYRALEVARSMRVRANVEIDRYYAREGHDDAAAIERVCDALDALSAASGGADQEDAPLVLDHGEVTLHREGDGFRLTVQTTPEGDAVSHVLTAAEASALAGAALRSLPEWGELVVRLDALAAVREGEHAVDTLTRAAVVRSARALVAAIPGAPSTDPAPEPGEAT